MQHFMHWATITACASVIVLCEAGDAIAQSTALPLQVTADRGLQGIDFEPLALRMEALQPLETVVFGAVPIPGRAAVDLELRRVTIASQDAVLALDDSMQTARLDAHLSLWTGKVVGEPASDVFLAFSPQGSRGWILTGESRFELVALPRVSGDWSASVSRLMPADLADALAGPRSAAGCGSTSIPQPHARSLPSPVDSGATFASSLPLLECRLALETDFQYYQHFANVDAARVYAVSLIGAISARYQAQVGVVLSLSYLGLHDSAADPWTTQEAGGTAEDLLDEFAAKWGAGHAPAPANIHHFLSGATFSGNFGGIAYISALCDQTYGFGVTGFKGVNTPLPVTVSSLNWDFNIVAHEIGHNFGAIHTHQYCPPLDQCASPPDFGSCQTQKVCSNTGTIMSYCDDCAGGELNITTFFHTQSAADMRATALASCLGLYQAPCGVVPQAPLYPAQRRGVGTNPWSIAAAEVTGDGKTDLIVANFGAGTAIGALSLLPGAGFGGFAATVDLTTAPLPFGLVVGDVNGDGRKDVVTSSYAGASLSVLKANAGGTFDAPSTFSAGGQGYGLAMGDLNGDGRQDLVAAVYTGALSVLLGDGVGGFGPLSSVATGFTAVDVVLADVNGDGKQDAVTASFESSRVTVLLGDGLGGFAVAASYPTGTNPQRLSISDLNGDGKRDIASANYGAGTVSVLLGTGGGAFAPASSFATGAAPTAVAIADLNGDLVPDLAVSALGSDSLDVLIGTGAGGFGASTSFKAGPAPSSVVLVDLNADGFLDAAVTNSAGNGVSVLLGNGMGGFITPKSSAAGDGAVEVALGDLDHDGKLDLVTALYYPGDIAVSLGTGSGSFSLPAFYASGVQTEGVAIADLNGDGHLDVAAANTGSSTVSVWFGLGNGSLSGVTSYGVGLGPTFVAVRDLNLDGKPEIVSCNSSSNTLSVLINDGTGGFASQSTWGVGANPHTVAIGDLDLDGNPDLVSEGYVSDTVTVLWGSGDGNFAASSAFPVSSHPYATCVGEFSGDSQPDIACCNAGTKDVSRLVGLGARSFILSGSVPVPGLPNRIVAADVDADGRQDVVTCNAESSSVSFLPGGGPCGFGAATSFVVGTDPDGLALGDVNGDGRPDAITGNFTSDDVSVLINQKNAWTDLHAGLAGTLGVPSLKGTGTLAPGSATSLVLSSARPSSTAILFVGLSKNPTPFKGGTLIPVPILLSVTLATSPAGAITLSFPWPAGFPGGFDLYYQCGIQDAAGPQGIALSNALKSKTP